MTSPKVGADGYSRRIQFYSEDVPQLLLETLGASDWVSYLDLGCGDGSLLYALNEQGYFKGKSVYAIDSSEARINLVRNINKELTCLVGDACKTQLDDGSIDLLVTTQVIEHVADDGKMVREMRRILSPGGRVYLSTVFKKRYAWYFYRCNNKWTLDPTHLREYTQEDQLLEILKANEFEIIANQKTLDGRPIADAILRRLRVPRNIYKHRSFKLLRALRVPIPGYYQWELVCRKR